MKSKVLFTIVCALFIQAVSAQTMKYLKPTYYNVDYKEAKVTMVGMPVMHETYTFENGFLTEILNTWGENKQTKSVFKYDFENGFFSVQIDVYREDTLSRSFSKQYECPVMENILASSRIDFIKDSRVDLFDLIGDTIFIYDVKRIDDPTKNSGFFYYDTIRREDQFLLFMFLPTKDATNNIVVETVKPGKENTIRIRSFVFNKSLLPSSKVDHTTSMTRVYTYKTNRKRIKKEIVDLTRKKEPFVYSTQTNKYKYNRKGLLTQQKTTTQYHLQGHTTGTKIKYIYSY